MVDEAAWSDRKTIGFKLNKSGFKGGFPASVIWNMLCSLIYLLFPYLWHGDKNTLGHSLGVNMG